MFNEANALAMIELARGRGVRITKEAVDALLTGDFVPAIAEAKDDDLGADIAVCFECGKDAHGADWVFWVGMTAAGETALLAIAPYDGRDSEKATNLNRKPLPANWLGWWEPRNAQRKSFVTSPAVVGDWMAGEMTGLGYWTLAKVLEVARSGEVTWLDAGGRIAAQNGKFFKLSHRNEACEILTAVGIWTAATWPALRSKLYFAQCRAVGKDNVVGRRSTAKVV